MHADASQSKPFLGFSKVDAGELTAGWSAPSHIGEVYQEAGKGLQTQFGRVGTGNRTAEWSIPSHIEDGRLLQTPASDWIMESKSVEIQELGCVTKECKRVDIDEQESLQLRYAFEEGSERPRTDVIYRMIVRLDSLHDVATASQHHIQPGRMVTPTPPL